MKGIVSTHYHHTKAVTLKYFSTEFVSQINYFYKSKFICILWFKNLAWITYLNLVLRTQTKCKKQRLRGLIMQLTWGKIAENCTHNLGQLFQTAVPL